MKDLIKRILKEETEDKDLIVPYRLEDRKERYKRIVYKKIQDYIKNGSKGNLDLWGTPIESLPSNLTTVGGDLHLQFSSIKSLPEELKIIYRHLLLNNSDIESLPKGLTVNGDLNLYENIQFKNLPDNLTVRGELDIYLTSVNDLPLNLTVMNGLDIRHTPFRKNYYDEHDIKELFRKNGGELYGNIKID